MGKAMALKTGLRAFLLLLCLLALFAAASARTRAAVPLVTVLTIKGTINPVLVDYVARGLEDARKDGAEAVIIQLDTPGGLDTAMRDIVQKIVNSPVPVVVYVSPSGARAGSAGVFITLAAHVAVMAPNTAIGAAHPVPVGGGGTSDTMSEKVLNDAAAYARSLAQSRHRDPTGVMTAHLGQIGWPHLPQRRVVSVLQSHLVCAISAVPFPRLAVGRAGGLVYM